MKEWKIISQKLVKEVIWGKNQASVRTRGKESVLYRVLDEGRLVYDKIRGS